MGDCFGCGRKWVFGGIWERGPGVKFGQLEVEALALSSGRKGGMEAAAVPVVGVGVGKAGKTSPGLRLQVWEPRGSGVAGVEGGDGGWV